MRFSARCVSSSATEDQALYSKVPAVVDAVEGGGGVGDAAGLVTKLRCVGVAERSSASGSNTYFFSTSCLRRARFGVGDLKSCGCRCVSSRRVLRRWALPSLKGSCSSSSPPSALPSPPVDEEVVGDVVRMRRSAATLMSAAMLMTIASPAMSPARDCVAGVLAGAPGYAKDGVEETSDMVVARVSWLALRLSLWLVAGVCGTSGEAARVSDMRARARGSEGLRTVAAALAVFFGGVHGCEGVVEGDGVRVLFFAVHGCEEVLGLVGSYIVLVREGECLLID